MLHQYHNNIISAKFPADTWVKPYNDDYAVFADLYEWGLVERKIEKHYNGKTFIGISIYFKYILIICLLFTACTKEMTPPVIVDNHSCGLVIAVTDAGIIVKYTDNVKEFITISDTKYAPIKGEQYCK